MSDKRRPWEDIDGPLGPPEAPAQRDEHIGVEVSEWAQDVMETYWRMTRPGEPYSLPMAMRILVETGLYGVRRRCEELRHIADVASRKQ